MATTLLSVAGQTTFATQAGGKQADAWVSEVHGKYFSAGYNNNTFLSSTVIAGVVIPVAAATLSSKFTIWNPAGSGKNIELISFHLGTDTATTVANGIGLMIQRNLTGTSGIPTTVTTAYTAPLGVGGTAQAVVATQATLTNVAIPGVSAATPVPIPYYNMFTFGAVTDTAAQELTHNFDGRIILGPDSLAAAVTSVAASQASVITICWAEWPV